MLKRLLKDWEMEPYFKLAEKYGYMVFTMVVENRHGGKNLHGVPDDTLEKMKSRFEIQLLISELPLIEIK